MASKNRFAKNTLGVDAEVLVTKGVEYSAQTDIKSFVANAVEGELAVFNAETATILTSAASVGDKVFIGLKRDGNLERTSTFTIEAGMLKKIAYVAPVKQVSTITTTGAPATLAVQDITFYAKQAGEDGNDITVTYTEAVEAGSEVATVSGTDITVQIDSGESTATQVLAAINAAPTVLALVSAAITGTAGTAQVSAVAANLAGGVDEFAIAKNDYAELEIIETTPGLEPLPRYNYSVTATAGETFQALMVRLVAKINDSTNIENQNKTLIVTAAIDGAAGVSRDNITLTAIDYNVHFTVALRGILADYASHAVTTVFKIGSGTPEQAKIAEVSGDIRKGVTTQYPVQNAVASEFGAPTSFADANGDVTYVVYTIGYVAKDQARTLETITRKNWIFLYVYDATADPISELDTIFANAD